MNSNDGTTGIQVAPIPTESEMASIRQFFANVTNALVNASELAKHVAELETKFATLNQDHTSVMARNDELVLSLNEVRLQRDQAQSELVIVKSERDNAVNEIGKLNSEADFTLNKINGLEETLRKANDDRDYAIDEWHKAAKEAADAKAALAEAKSHAMKAFGLVAPKAEPIPQPTDPKLEEIIQGYPYGQPEPSVNPEPRPLSDEEVAAPKYEWDPNKF